MLCSKKYHFLHYVPTFSTCPSLYFGHSLPIKIIFLESAKQGLSCVQILWWLLYKQKNYDRFIKNFNENCDVPKNGLYCFDDNGNKRNAMSTKIFWRSLHALGYLCTKFRFHRTRRSRVSRGVHSTPPPWLKVWVPNTLVGRGLMHLSTVCIRLQPCILLGTI